MYCTLPPKRIPYLQNGQDGAANESQANDSPSGDGNLLVGDAHGKIPHQVPDAVEAVESERKADEELGRELGDNRPGAEGSGERGALEVPAQGGGGQVSEAEDVEGARHDDSGQTVEHRQVPGNLGLVDAEMRCYGTVQALFGEDLARGLGIGDNLGCGESTIVSFRCRFASIARS